MLTEPTPKSLLLAVWATLALAGAIGCTNSQLSQVNKKTKQSNLNVDSAIDYVISTVNIVVSPNSSADSPPTTRIFFDTTKSEAPISQVCNVVADGSVTQRACNCLFSWAELNRTSGTVVPVPRKVQTKLTSVQPNLIECQAPAVYASEIPQQTLIKISVVPAGNNGENFAMTPFNYSKTVAAATASFQDAEGRAYNNVFRYACYDQFKRGMEINSRRGVIQNAAGQVVNPLMATNFCFTKGGGNGQNTEECPGQRPGEHSAQSYYYNLYIRNTDPGAFNLSNDRYRCPNVKEAISASTARGGGYPLDSTFALSHLASADFPIGVEAFSKLGGASEGSAVSSGCYQTGADSSSTGSTGSANASLIKSCLGFAAKPLAGGLCPSFKDSAGNVKPTYRLRRYVALYPALFDTDGKLLEASQPSDTIYVLDRPVTYSGADPLKLYTMAGPKPCPFAYFDHKAVLTPYPGTAACTATPTLPGCDYSPALSPNGPKGMPSYASTNFAGWNGKNVDGIGFPNIDSGNSCSAAIPLLNSDKTAWSIGTVNASNPAQRLRELHIRPVRAWAPHYEEDVDFLACAPLSTTFRDPPLHFAKDAVSGNVGWCAEVYPSQNPNVKELEPVAAIAQVVNFTSHGTKNSTSAICAATIPSAENFPAGYLAGGAANHPASLVADASATSGGVCGNGTVLDGGLCKILANRTCDRTTENTLVTFPKFPLLARPQQVEAVLSTDSSYQCTLTYDAGNGKEGKFTPTEGCCGANVKVWSGVGSPAGGPFTTAHLEPDASCQVPTY